MGSSSDSLQIRRHEIAFLAGKRKRRFHLLQKRTASHLHISVPFFFNTQQIVKHINIMASTAAAPPASRQQRRHATGTQTQTETPLPPILNNRQPVLRLRGVVVPRSNEPRVQWAEDVVDNEHMGKKSSKGAYCSVPTIISQIPFM